MLLLACALQAPPVWGAGEPPSKLACIEAYEQNQQLRQQAHLLAARQKLILCSQSACPEAVRRDCLGWLAEVEAATPSVVIVVRAADGGDLVDAALSIDGVRVAEKMDGRALVIDPGGHVFRVESPQHQTLETRVTIAEGEKGRLIRLELRPLSAAPSASAAASAQAASATPPAAASASATAADAAPPKDAGPPALDAGPAPSRTIPIALFATSGAALVSFATFAGLGLSGKSTLDACRPRCADDEIARVKSRFLGADISLVVAVLAAAGGAYTWHAGNKGAASAHAPAASSTIRWNLPRAMWSPSGPTTIEIGGRF